MNVSIGVKVIKVIQSNTEAKGRSRPSRLDGKKN